MQTANDTKAGAGYLNFIAYAQIIGIILVVFGHSFHEYPDGNHGTSLLIYRLFYSFRMPLFLFVSGFLMVYTTGICHKTKKGAGAFVMSKVKRLVLPMVVLTAITFVPRAMMSFASDDVVSLDAKSFALSFIHMDYMPIPYFWFLHVSFILLSVSFCLMHIFNRMGVSPKVTILVIFALLLAYSLSSLPSTALFSIQEIKRIGLFFALGGVYGAFFDRIDAVMPWTAFWFFPASFAIWFATFFMFEHTEWIMICAFFGILMSISFCKILEKQNWNFLDHLKGANYLIFLISWYFNTAFQQVLSHFTTLPWWVYTLLSFFAGIYVPWYAYRYLQRHRDSRWVKVTALLLGQSLRPSR